MNKTDFNPGKLTFFSNNHLLVSDKPDFPAEEVKILEFWKKIDAFQT